MPTVSTVEKGYQANASWWALPDDFEKNVELRWPRSIDVYDSMRRQDAQCMSVLRAVTLPLRKSAWRVEPNGARPEIVQHIAEDLGLPVVGQDATPPPLRRRGRFSWVEHLRLALLMLPFGHSYFEQVYRIDDAGLAHLRKLGWRPPRTISAFDVASDGGLIAIRQFTEAGSEPCIPVENLVAYVLDREGGNWVGQSVLRPAYKFWLLKDRALRTQSMALDRNGLGVPVYTAGQQTETLDAEKRRKYEEEEIAAGLELVKAYRGGETSGAALRNGAELALLGVNGKLPDADKPIRYYDEQIARAVLAHFLNLGTETGSWALGSTFADFFTMSLNAVATDVADTATHHIVEDLVDINWGPDERAPRVVCDEIGSQHAATAEAVKSLIECGAIHPDESLEQHIRTTYGLPAAARTESNDAQGDAADAREAAEVSQKVYLAVTNEVLTKDEGRRLIDRAGGQLQTGDPS